MDEKRRDSGFTDKAKELGQHSRLPDFIIAGANKSGTSSLHHILSQHRRIFIPGRERHFFNMDDFQRLPTLHAYHRGKWWTKEFEDRLDHYLRWYTSYFEDAQENQLVGEDSATYLTSEKAPERISKVLPDAKIILMLRDPASRSYSHYWHRVRTGQAIFRFEDEIRLSPEYIIEGSLYKKHIGHFMKFFPSEKMLIILFEEFVNDTQKIIDQTCKFLDVPLELNVNEIQTHQNPARLPRSIGLQLWRNRLLHRLVLYRNWEQFPEMPEAASFCLEKTLLRIADRVHRLFNASRPARPPKMRSETRNFLNRYFARENEGLADLIGMDVNRYWYQDYRP